MSASLLEVRNLTVTYSTDGGVARAVDDVSLDVRQGERVGVVGESGSGKTTLALALMRLLPPWASQVGGEILLEGVELTSLPADRLRLVRGGRAGMVFQDPLRSFDPLRTIGYHLSEGLRAHGRDGRDQRRSRAIDTLRAVGLPAPEQQLRRRPYELSGGMLQRSLIALGLQNEPRLLIADEPTTALDVTIQAQIVELFETIGAPGPREQMGLLLVSHNLGLVRQLCTRVVVMYGGRVVEDSPVEAFFAGPRHPYGAALLGAMPKISGPRGKVVTIPGQPVDLTALPPGCAFAPRCSRRVEVCTTAVPALAVVGARHRVACVLGGAAPLPIAPEPLALAPDGASAAPDAGAPVRGAVVRAADTPSAAYGRTEEAAAEPVVRLRQVTKTFRVRTHQSFGARPVSFRALDAVDLELFRGETLAVVGESGSGKSTLARILLGVLSATSGEVRVGGEDPTDRHSEVRRNQRVQAVFQDPHGSLDPRMRVSAIVGEPLVNLGHNRAERRARVLEVLDEVRLNASFADRYPHELSGGQAQRVAIARALVAGPTIIVLDEPTSALDVSIQTHVVSLLRDLQGRHGLTYLFVSHDLAAVRELATRVAVMYLGKLVELAPADDFFARQLHPYAAALLSAVPRADEAPAQSRRIVLKGEPPSALAVPPGCPFHPRCPVAADACSTSVPPLVEHAGGRRAACHFPGSLAPGSPIGDDGGASRVAAGAR